MIRRTVWTLAAATAALTVAGTAAALPVLAQNGHASRTDGQVLASRASASTAAPDTSGPAAYFAASLVGRNEVPVAGKPAVGDPDGRAVELLRVQGNAAEALTNPAPPSRRCARECR
jgi:hypothetical protein